MQTFHNIGDKIKDISYSIYYRYNKEDNFLPINRIIGYALLKSAEEEVATLKKFYSHFNDRTIEFAIVKATTSRVITKVSG